MRYLVVLLVSLAAGAIAYLISIRSGERDQLVGFEPGTPAEEPPYPISSPPSPGYDYLRVEVTDGPSVRERLQGLVGSLALIAVAMIATAGALWTVGVLIGRIVRSFVDGSGSGTSP